MKENYFEKTNQSLSEKYDAKNHAGVREIRKELMLEQNPNIMIEKGDTGWIDYLYNTPIVGELELYKMKLKNKINKIRDIGVLDSKDEDIFDPTTGTFKGFLSTEEKNSSIEHIQNEIDEVNQLIEK